MKTMLDVKVPMRDKVNLAANVFLPDGDGPFPVVLNRTPYLKDTSERTRRMHELVEAGYAAVTMDVRGRGNSEGEFRPVFQEIKDGFDSLKWCGTQAWSSGKVGTIGGSYEGWTQVYPMRLQSPHHAAACLFCTPSMHPFHEVWYSSGVPMPIMMLWAIMTSGRTMKEQITDLDWEKAVSTRPLKDVLANMGLAIAHYETLAKHETFDDFYRELWDEGVWDRTRVPCYHISGWFDDDLKGTLEHFPAFGMHHPDPEVRRSQKLLIGPWPHRLSIDTSKIGDFDYGPQSIVPLYKEAVRWFDYWLKGIDNGIMDEPRCRMFLMGANRWMESDTFPLAEGRERSFLLAADGPANSLVGQGVLGEKHGSLPSSHFTYNPERPAPTPFWKENFQNGTNEDLRPIQRRDDVLVFTSEPMAEPLNAVGVIRAELYVSTSALDTDFVARLSDVGPDGYASRLNAGIFRLRYREGYEKVKPVKPGEVMKITVDMWGTGHQFQAGHRVRLDVTSSAYPTWAPNYNTGGSIWEEATPVVAEQTIYHSEQYPSHLVLTEVPEPEFAEAWTESRWRKE
jgi:putative CocE/NonD family hydrolase